jgi:peptidoglycan/xylan/chitin deacetylase (PgdA/CDA1 family)
VIRLGRLRFCRRGCSVIHLLDRLSTTEWRLVLSRAGTGGGTPRAIAAFGPRLAVGLARARLTAHVARLRAAHRLERRLGALPNPRQAGAVGLLGVALVAVGPDVARLGASPLFRPGGAGKAPVAAPPPASLVTASLSVPPDDRPRTSQPALPAAPRDRGIPAWRQGPVRDIVRGDIQIRQVALTLDGGAEANAAAEILDTLREREVRATVFLTGGFIRRYPEVVRRLVREGHEVGNHTDTHPHLTSYASTGRHETLPEITREVLHGELGRAAEAFARATGGRLAPYWRAPYGEQNAELRAWAAELGYRHVSWTHGVGEDLDTRDWVADRRSPIYRSAEAIRDRILAFGRGRPEEANGGIILMHLGTARAADRAHARLGEIIDGLRHREYRLVTIGELLGAGREIASAGSPSSD